MSRPGGRRWSWAAGIALLAAGCRAGATAPAAPATAEGAGSGPAWLVDVAADAGLDFRHRSGLTGDLYFVEIMGAGAALADLDADGDLDAFLAQGAPLRPGPAAAPTSPGPAPEDPLAWRDRVYRNDTAPGRPDSLRFTDVTAASGMEESGYGMGVAAGDVDDDGLVDLYVTNWGPNQLWRNQGGGRFEDIAPRTGTADPAWSVSASLSDLDLDGRLDLFVADYVRYDYGTHKACYDSVGRPDYCSPKAYPPEQHRLWLGRPGGAWEEATAAWGLEGHLGNGLGVVSADLGGDAWPDLYVANDQMDNHLWLGQSGRAFSERAAQAGVAVGGDGRQEASMGLAAEDFDGDGDVDLFVTNLKLETNTLYVREGDALFADRTDAAGLGGQNPTDTGFGIGAADLDMDGWLDLVTINGAVVKEPDQVAAGEARPLLQVSRVYRNTGRGAFERLPAAAAPALATPAIGRGLAAGDVDNDGDVDMLVTRNEGPALLLRNDAAGAHPWVGLRLLTAGGKRDALGALVRLVAPAHPMGATQLRRAHTDGSYASARDPRVLLALPDGAASADVEITWPDGTRETRQGLAAGRYHEVRQGG